MKKYWKSLRVPYVKFNSFDEKVMEIPKGTICKMQQFSSKIFENPQGNATVFIKHLEKP